MVSALAVSCASTLREDVSTLQDDVAALKIAHGILPDDGSVAKLDFLVHFLGVDGDAIIIETPDALAVIDGGSKRGFLEARIRERFGPKRKVDLVVMTHPDRDHHRGLRRLVQSRKVGELWDPGYNYNDRCNPTGLDEWLRDSYWISRRVFERAERNKTLDNYVRPLLADGRYSFNEPIDKWGMRLTILSAEEDASTENRRNCAYQVNNASIVLKVELQKKHRFLFTGDINGRLRSRGYRELPIIDIERKLVTDPRIDLRANVLKVPHHGSRTSSTYPFMSAVLKSQLDGPRFAVSTYRRILGRLTHPSKTVVQNYRALGIRTFVVRGRRSQAYCWGAKRKLMCGHNAAFDEGRYEVVQTE